MAGRALEAVSHWALATLPLPPAPPAFPTSGHRHVRSAALGVLAQAHAALSQRAASRSERAVPAHAEAWEDEGDMLPDPADDEERRRIDRENSE
ncbi:hypothetical protein SAMN05421748_11075 [Paractinoplanes atraurantiacus]|uniref:Uncharacterized protein n=1 Tax=Paractinoplanes atraurantiacus TaxID=1036182 RepID=A0A285INQ5_9ACTN|nr:hypothetical protein [Actinoplanes atraurantiacus]SNY49645.1 hypothetical protein SAMN05421748_11075 [Actinoplanes atraurantiacus]